MLPISEFKKLSKLSQLSDEERAWVAACRGPAEQRPAEPVVVEVLAARHGHRAGTIEYLARLDCDTPGEARWMARPSTVAGEA